MDTIERQILVDDTAKTIANLFARSVNEPQLRDRFKDTLVNQSEKWFDESYNWKLPIDANPECNDAVTILYEDFTKWANS